MGLVHLFSLTYEGRCNDVILECGHLLHHLCHDVYTREYREKISYFGFAVVPPMPCPACNRVCLGDLYTEDEVDDKIDELSAGDFLEHFEGAIECADCFSEDIQEVNYDCKYDLIGQCK